MSGLRIDLVYGSTIARISRGSPKLTQLGSPGPGFSPGPPLGAAGDRQGAGNGLLNSAPFGSEYTQGSQGSGNPVSPFKVQGSVQTPQHSDAFLFHARGERHVWHIIFHNLVVLCKEKSQVRNAQRERGSFITRIQIRIEEP